MVEHLHHLFGGDVSQSVINAGAGVKNDHRSTVNCTTDHAPSIVMKSGKNYAKNGGDYTKSTAHNVGDHIENFFTSCVVGQFAVSKFCSCHMDSSFRFYNSSIAHKTANINYDSVNNSKTIYVIRF